MLGKEFHLQASAQPQVHPGRGTWLFKSRQICVHTQDHAGTAAAGCIVNAAVAVRRIITGIDAKNLNEAFFWARPKILTEAAPAMSSGNKVIKTNFIKSTPAV